jgi:hypothetical protein
LGAFAGKGGTRITPNRLPFNPTKKLRLKILAEKRAGFPMIQNRSCLQRVKSSRTFMQRSGQLECLDAGNISRRYGPSESFVPPY